jgi:hypothetical protein|nr:MAG TPA: DNA-directed RNA polymerase [Caudoviricetes sp.]
MNKLIEAIETIQDMLDVSERTGSAYVYTHNGGNERIRNVLEQLQTYKELREKNTKLLPVADKITELDLDCYKCPKCDHPISHVSIHRIWFDDYCSQCGQAIDVEGIKKMR